MDNIEQQLCNLTSYEAIQSLLKSIVLHPLQCVDILKMVYSKKSIVIYPTGTGKTLLAAGAIKLLMRENPKRQFIMFVKKDQLIQTPEKLSKLLGINIVCSSADSRDIQNNLLSINFTDYPLFLLTHECLRNNVVLDLLYKNKESIAGIIIDEAHKMNNFTKAETGEMLSAVVRNFEYVWGLTATPIITDINQFAKLAYIVNRDRYSNPSMLAHNLKSGRFSISMDPMFFINRTDEELGRVMKPLGLVRWVEPMTHQRNVACGGVELMQVCKGQNATNQVRALISLIESHKGEKGLVYVNQGSIRRWILPFFEEANIKYACINGETPQKERKEIMHKFNDLGEIDIVITSVTTAIDLDSNFVIFYEFTVEVDQMIGRAHRGLGNKQLKVYFIITSGTAEIRYFLENIYQRCVLIQNILDKGNVAVLEAGEEVGASGSV